MSVNLDLHAEVVAGKSAAGFRIGMNMHEIDHLHEDAEVIEYFEGYDFVRKINETEGFCIHNWRMQMPNN